MGDLFELEDLRFFVRYTLICDYSLPLSAGRWSTYSDDMATTSSMFMYSLTVQPSSAITQAILGQFAGTKEQQIVTASGSRLTIHRPDSVQGKVSAIFSQDCFGIIRTLAAFRLAGSNKGMSSQTMSQTLSDFGTARLRPGQDTSSATRRNLVPAVTVFFDLASALPAVCSPFANSEDESG